MSWEHEVLSVTEALGLDPSRLDPSRRALCFLLRAGAELEPLCREGGDDGYALAVLGEWARLVDPDVSGGAVTRLVARHTGHASTGWMAGFGDDNAVPLALIVLALLTLLPPGLSHLHAAWLYVEAVAGQLGQTALVSPGRGWLRGEAGDDMLGAVGGLVRTAADRNEVTRALARWLEDVAADSKRARPAASFLTAREKVLSQVEVVLRHAEDLHLDRQPHTRLREFAANDHFRIAVLGEFKRGKSTLINALIGKPNFMPNDVLPCTSGLIELRHGAREEYRRRGSSHPTDEGELVDRSVFLTSAGNAASAGSTTGAEAVPRWRVTVDSPFLKAAFVEIVDSPGLGEDPARDHLAKEEAQRADAAILVLSAKQIASSTELDLIASMQAKLHNLVLAVNQGDLVSELERGRLLRHVLDRLKQRRLEIPPGRVLLVSAQQACASLERGDTSSHWAHEMARLREVVHGHLISMAGPRKGAVLAAKAREAVTRGRADVVATLAKRRALLQDLENLASNREKVRGDLERARKAIRESGARLREHGFAVDLLMTAFVEGLPAILERVEKGSDKWTTDHHPLFSPRAHVEEVAEKAKQAVLAEVASWLRQEGVGVLGNAIQDRLALAAEQTTELREYVRAVRGQEAVSDTAFLETLQLASLEAGFGDLGVGDQTADAVVGVAVASVISTIIGYIVADIVLFYILGIISGFLNPFLLAAALVGGAAVWLTMGEDAVRAWIRGNVFEKIKENLVSEETQAKIRDGLRHPVREIFLRLSDGFEESAREVLDEASYQERKVGEELERLTRDGGDPAAVAAELARLQAAASRTHEALNELEKAVASIAGVPPSRLVGSSGSR